MKIKGYENRGQRQSTVRSNVGVYMYHEAEEEVRSWEDAVRLTDELEGVKDASQTVVGM